MKITQIIGISGLVTVLLGAVAVKAWEFPTHDPNYSGSKFRVLWQMVAKDPYKELPLYQTTLESIGGFAATLFKADAVRTLNSESDLIPLPQSDHPKLIRPNGICLSGTWEIFGATRYSGYFRPGKGLVIARASVGLDQVNRSQGRSFGMAGKIFPTLDPEENVKTGNFFVIDDNLGRKGVDYLESKMTNEPTANGLGFLGDLMMVLKHGLTLGKIKGAQKRSDPLGHEGIRQLWPIARLGGVPVSEVLAPKYIEIRAVAQNRIRQEDEMLDFRTEIQLAAQSSPVEFEIRVGESKAELSESSPVGKMLFTEAVASKACDSQIHFAHPLWVEE